MAPFESDGLTNLTGSTTGGSSMPSETAKSANAVSHARPDGPSGKGAGDEHPTSASTVAPNPNDARAAIGVGERLTNSLGTGCWPKQRS